MLVGEIRVLETTWESITVGAAYEGIVALEIVLGLEFVVDFTTTKHSDKHLQKDLLFLFAGSLFHLDL